MRAAAAISLALVAGAAHAFTMSEVPRAYRTTVPGTTIYTADFDLDGAVDLLKPGPKGAMSVLYGEGDGSFEPETVLARDWSCRFICPSSGREPIIVDVDDDGDMDIFYFDHATMRLIENIAPRRFLETASWAIWTTVTIADFTGDGYADVLRYGETDLDGTLMINDRRGRFPRSKKTGAPQSWYRYFGDFDGDGDIDLAVTNSDSKGLIIFVNDGTGSFRAGPTIPERSVAGFFVADLDADRRDDLVALRWESAGIAVYFARDFSAPPVVLHAGTDPYAAVAADFDGDRQVDLAVDYEYGVTVFRGDGRGGFTPMPQTITPWGGFTAADFDGDDVFDLAVIQWNYVAIIRGNGDGTFRVPPRIQLPGGTLNFEAGDLDGDGIDELLVSTYTYDGPSIGWMNGPRSYHFEKLPIPPISPSLRDVRLRDLEGDGRAEIILGMRNEVHVFSATGPGEWNVRSFPAGGEVRTVELAELAPASGHELVVVTHTSGRHDYTLRVFSSEGAPLFAVPLIPPPPPEWGGLHPVSFSIHAADADRDGRMDLLVMQHPSLPTSTQAVPSNSDGYVALLRGRNDGTLMPEERILHDALIYGFRAGDYDGNGTTDIELVVDTGQISFAGDGRGNFILRERLPLFPYESADFNRDGYPDFYSFGVIAYGSANGFQAPVGYLRTAVGYVPVRRSHTGPPALMAIVNYRGDAVVIEDPPPPPARSRAVRH